MKAAILLFIALAIAVSSFAQEKTKPGVVTPDTKTLEGHKTFKKPEYRKFVNMEVYDVQTCLQALVKWKDLVLFDSKIDDKEKVATYKNIEAYITELQKRIKIDSVLIVRPDSTSVKKK